VIYFEIFAEAMVGFSDKSASVRFTRFEYNVIYSDSLIFLLSLPCVLIPGLGIFLS